MKQGALERGCPGIIVNGVDRRHEQAVKPLSWVYDDGGRSTAGFRGLADDCTCRAIAIAAEQDYRAVYDTLNRAAAIEAVARGHLKSHRPSSARTGVAREVYDDVLRHMGWWWVPTMAIGQGCTVHLRQDELPMGRLIVRLSRHMTAVIDGVIRDTHDPSRGGDRCVYGYWIAA